MATHSSGSMPAHIAAARSENTASNFTSGSHPAIPDGVSLDDLEVPGEQETSTRVNGMRWFAAQRNRCEEKGPSSIFRHAFQIETTALRARSTSRISVDSDCACESVVADSPVSG